MICRKFKIQFLLSFLFLIVAAGCHAQLETSPQEVSKSGKPDPDTAKIIRDLAPQAAGMPDADFKNLVGGGVPDAVRSKNQALTHIIMCHIVMSLPEEMQKDRSPELRFSETTPNPSKLVDLIKPTTTVDCWTALHPKYCLLYTSPSPRDATLSRMPSSA